MVLFPSAILLEIGHLVEYAHKDTIVSWVQLFLYHVLVVHTIVLLVLKVLHLAIHVHEGFTVQTRVMFTPMVSVYKDTTVQLDLQMLQQSRQSRVISHWRELLNKAHVKQELTLQIITKLTVVSVLVGSIAQFQPPILLFFAQRGHIALTVPLIPSNVHLVLTRR